MSAKRISVRFRARFSNGSARWSRSVSSWGSSLKPRSPASSRFRNVFSRFSYPFSVSSSGVFVWSSPCFSSSVPSVRLSYRSRGTFRGFPIWLRLWFHVCRFVRVKASVRSRASIAVFLSTTCRCLSRGAAEIIFNNLRVIQFIFKKFRMSFTLNYNQWNPYTFFILEIET